MNYSPTSVVLLGFTIDDEALGEIAQKSDVMPTQTHRFAWNLVSALKSADVGVSLLSVLPVPNYPEYPHKLIRSTPIYQNDVRGITMGFLNVLALKHVTRFFSCLSRGMRFIECSKPEFVLVHGVHTPFLLFARLVKRVMKLRICVIMTDPPGVVRGVDGRIARMLKSIDRHLVKSLASGFDGVICLTSALAADFAPRLPKLILEGFANPELSHVRSDSSGASEGLHVAYAGGINVEYGVANLVKAFRSIKDPSARLQLYGKGPLDAWVLEQSELDSRIVHNGLLSHEELIPKLGQASILVNPRPAAQNFVRYSFPSKLLEYMALGVPVVTTRLAGIPDGYLQYVQTTDDDSVGALAEAIKSVGSFYAGAVERASRGQVYVMQEKSVAPQGERIAEFLLRLKP